MYYYGGESLIGYLRNNLPVFDAMPDCFKCKNTEFANDNVCIVEAGRNNCVLYLVNGKVDVIEFISGLIRILGNSFYNYIAGMQDRRLDIRSGCSSF